MSAITNQHAADRPMAPGAREERAQLALDELRRRLRHVYDRRVKAAYPQASRQYADGALDGSRPISLAMFLSALSGLDQEEGDWVLDGLRAAFAPREVGPPLQELAELCRAAGEFEAIGGAILAAPAVSPRDLEAETAAFHRLHREESDFHRALRGQA